MRALTACLVVASIVAAASLLDASPARACGACLVEAEAVPRAPSFRREPLPRNLRLFVDAPGPDAGPDAPTLRVHADGGTAAIATVVEEDADGAAGAWLRPAGELPAGTTLVVGEGSLVTGDVVDDTPPSPPVVTLPGARADLCCSTVNVTIAATAAVDDDGTPPQALRVEVRDDASTRSFLFAYVPAMQLPLGVGDCLGTDALAVDGAGGELFVSVIDWAGNESDVVGPLAFSFAATDPAGCPGTPGPGDVFRGGAGAASCLCAGSAPDVPAASLVVVVVGALAATRRRPRPSPSS